MRWVLDSVELRSIGGLELDLSHLELESLEPGDQVGVHRLVLAGARLGRGRVVDVLQSHADVVRQLRAERKYFRENILEKIFQRKYFRENISEKIF